MNRSERIDHLAFIVAMETAGRRARNRLLSLARNPEAAQRGALQAILQACRETEQGIRLGLGRLETPDQFRAAVPIQTYEQMKAGIDRQIEAGVTAIAPTRPLMYARSSGTTGSPKYIPVTDETLSQMRGAQRAQAFAQYKALSAFDGKIIGLVGSRREEALAGGAYAGAATGLIYETMPRCMRAKYVIPSAVSGIEDYDTKYAVSARLVAQEKDVTSIATANPSSILRLLEYVRRDLPVLADEIERGETSALSRVDPTLAEQIRPAMRADPARAEALRAMSGGAGPTLSQLWPRVRAITTWRRGGCALAAEAVQREAPRARLVDAGYVASEVRGTVVIDVKRNLALPLLGDVFFEFAPVADWDAGIRDTRLLHELEEGADYHVIITTAAGLLRYHMNDVLRAGPRIGATPTFEFVRKGRGATNITGEKLTEDQIHLAMKDARPSQGSRPPFYVVLADVRTSGYTAYVEDSGADAATLAEALDRKLCDLNIEYAAKRASGRLKPINVTLLRPGTETAYYRHCIETRKQREAQLKYLVLQDAMDSDFDFAAYGKADAGVLVQGR